MQVSASTVTDATWLFNGPPVRISIIWDHACAGIDPMAIVAEVATAAS